MNPARRKGGPGLSTEDHLRCGRPLHTAQSGHLHQTYDDLPRSVASSWTGATDGDLLFQACHLVSQIPLVPLEVFGSPFHLEKDMARTYEYWTVKDGEDISINLTVAYYSARKGNFSSQAADPDEYFGHCEINWESKDDTSFMTESEIAQMEEWLVNEHSEYLADLEYFD